MNAAAPVRSEATRILIEATLRPVQGDRFQPTGFPDLGPATYPANGTEMLLVESVQSMANRLEECGWDGVANRPVPALEGLPYVRVLDAAGEFLSSSRQEAHRLASAMVRDSRLDGGRGETLLDLMRERLGIREGVPMDHRAVARAIFSLDPLSLLHGVFFAIKPWPFQPKIARVVSSFIEASKVRDAYSGGLKRDDVLHSVKGLAESAESGYGNIPYPRREFTAERIVAYFNVDLTQLRSFGLGEPAEAMLQTLALWEIRCLLERSMRLRTACDLEPTEVRVKRPDGFEPPPRGELESALPALIEGCGPLCVEPRVLVGTWAPATKPAKAAKPGPAETETESE